MMVRDNDHYGLTARLIDALHIEALILADESRSYFDRRGREERDMLPPPDRVLFSCESLKVTTRLTHIVSWLLTRRGPTAGTVSAMPQRALGQAVTSDIAATAGLPVTARQLIDASRDLHDRVLRLEARMAQGATGTGGATSPTHVLMRRLEQMW